MFRTIEPSLRIEVALTASLVFFFQAEDGIRDYKVTGVQTCALPISLPSPSSRRAGFANHRKAHHRFPTSRSGERRGGVGTARPHGARAWTIGLSGEVIERKVRALAAATHGLPSRLRRHHDRCIPDSCQVAGTPRLPRSYH